MHPKAMLVRVKMFIRPHLKRTQVFRICAICKKQLDLIRIVINFHMVTAPMAPRVPRGGKRGVQRPI